MLAKKNRLTAKSLKHVGRFSLYRGIFFDAKKIEKDPYSYSVIIGSKTCKRAVDRNKIKRLFYRILSEEILRQKDIYKKDSYIFYPKKECLVTIPSFIKEELLLYLKK